MSNQAAAGPAPVYRHALSNLGYEVLPFTGIVANVCQHVPTSIPLSVTASPQKGVDATIEVATQLAAEGYAVTPHLSARLMRSRQQLDSVLSQLSGSQITRLFIVGGDGEPRGPFVDASTLLGEIHHMSYQFSKIGIGGYPDGHASIAHEALEQALIDKAGLAHYITTQMCFDARKVRVWADNLATRGVTLPVHVGVPGTVSRQKLLRISSSIGIGDSAKFLRRQQKLLWRFFMPGGYSPTKLVRSLAPAMAPQTVQPKQSNIAGFHIFTFNDLAGTEQWRRHQLARLAAR